MVMMLAPPGATVGQSVKVLSGATYTIDSYSFVSVTSQFDVVYLQNQGFSQLPGGRYNLTATTDPAAGSDNTQDFAPGSLWINTTASPNRAWLCVSAATSAAVWLQISIGALIGSANNASLGNLTLTALLTQSAATAVTPFNGGGQGSATALTTFISNVSSSIGSSAPFDSTKLQPAAAGLSQIVLNTSSHSIALFPNGSDAIVLNGTNFGASASIVIPVNFVFIGWVTASGTWTGLLFGTTGDVSGLGFTVNFIFNTNSATSGTTLTGANLTGALQEVTLDMTGTMTGDSNAQLPTVANLVAAIPNLMNGYVYKLRIINSSSANHVWTVTTNTGWTLNGTMTIAQNTWRDFQLTLTSSSAAVLLAIGTGTFS